MVCAAVGEVAEIGVEADGREEAEAEAEAEDGVNPSTGYACIDC